MAAPTPRVIVVGAGIGGLVTALSVHEIGMRVDVYERVRSLQPLGVGINLLPHAVRELDALGILAPLRRRAVEPTSLVYCSRHGREIWREPRGVAAGYPWPQLSVHRGVLQEVLLDAFDDAGRPRAPPPRPPSADGGCRRRPRRRGVRRGAGRGRARRGGRCRGRGRRHPQHRACPAVSGRGWTAVERLVALAWDRRGRAGARRSLDDLGRPPGPEVRGLPDRRPSRRPAGVQLRRRAPSTGVGARCDRGLEPRR